jgi:hypothetical protein
MADAFHFPPTFYGEPTDEQKAMICACVLQLGMQLDSVDPLITLNVGMLLTAMGMSNMECRTPDIVANDIADCAVRSFAACEAFVGECKKERH